jgi:hypothetical protein
MKKILKQLENSIYEKMQEVVLEKLNGHPDEEYYGSENIETDTCIVFDIDKIKSGKFFADYLAENIEIKGCPNISNFLNNQKIIYTNE